MDHHDLIRRTSWTQTSARCVAEVVEDWAT
jgi:hypothetical protein